ncbi:hypothetical protein D3C85_1565960 [compost metagenome]
MMGQSFLQFPEYGFSTDQLIGKIDHGTQEVFGFTIGHHPTVMGQNLTISRFDQIDQECIFVTKMFEYQSLRNASVLRYCFGRRIGIALV